VQALIAAGNEVIPFLIGKLDSESAYAEPILDYWPEMQEGDVAFIVLASLFTNPRNETSLPELCWDRALGREPDSRLSSRELLVSYIATHGRSAVKETWTTVWVQHADNIYWDEEQRFFRVRGLPLVSCAQARGRRPTESLAPTPTDPPGS
jgi:hypothetical protein